MAALLTTQSVIDTNFEFLIFAAFTMLIFYVTVVLILAMHSKCN